MGSQKIPYEAASGGTTSPLTTKGDVYVYGSANARLPIGADGTYLAADSTQTLGVGYKTPSAGTADSVSKTVYNDTGATILKGANVYISGWKTGSEVPTIALAKADSATTMPALGKAVADILNLAEGEILTFGTQSTIDTSAYSLSDTLYVSAATAGADTNTKPVGSNLIQRIAVVTRSNPTVGTMFIAGALRSNDIPNFTAEGKFWVGGTGGVATEGDISGSNTGDQAAGDFAHNDLSNLNAGDYVHLTAAEAVVVGNTSGANTGDQSLTALALKSNVLELDNTTSFTPDADYEPATKKYVDDNSGGGATIWNTWTGAARTSDGVITSTTNLLPGTVIRYKATAGAYVYGFIKSIATNAHTINGAACTVDYDDVFEYSDTIKVKTENFLVSGAFADAAETTMLQSDLLMQGGLRLKSHGFILGLEVLCTSQDTGAAEPRINIKIGADVVFTANTNTGIEPATTPVNSGTGLDITKYDFALDDTIEMTTDANGTNNDAMNLSAQISYIGV